MPDHNVTNMAPELSESSSHSHPPLVAAEKPAEDGYKWRKYGQKQVKGSEYTRSYFNYSRENPSIIKDQESSHEMSGSWDNDDVAKHQAKKRNIEAKGFDPVTSYGTLRDSRIVVQATSKIDVLDDGY
ncbi:DNA-binding WRKY transcription factor [Tanacetum coccineum]